MGLSGGLAANGGTSGGSAATLSVSGFIAQSYSLYAVSTPSAFAPGVNTAVFTAFKVPISQTIDAIGLNIGTASGNVCVGVYDNTGTGGGPGARLSTSGSVASPSAGAARIAVPSITCAPGKYWAAFIADNGTVTISFVSVSLALVGLTPVRYNQAVTFPLPATAGATADTSGATYLLIPGKS